MSSETCFICVSNYNRSTRAQIVCPYCSWEACKDCYKKYLLSQFQDAHCIDCKKSWDRRIMLDKFGPSWVDSVYKEHREHILLDREKSLLPATQPAVEALIRDEQFETEIKEQQILIRELRKEIDHARTRIYEIEQKRYNKSTHKERQQFIRKCPKEDCRGFLSTQWKCGLCENFTCPDCNELIGPTRSEEHKCDPNHVETAKLLAKDTKPCPSCGTGIFKIEGCFGKDTPVLMWDGSLKCSQNICVGDVLIGDDGNPRNVLETFSGQDELYKVEQKNGLSYIVNSKHTLLVKYSVDKNIQWFEKEQIYKIFWFCRDDKRPKTKNFKVIDYKSKEECLLECKKWSDTYLNFKDDVIEILVEDYMKISKGHLVNILGFKVDKIRWPVFDMDNIDSYTLSSLYIWKTRDKDWMRTGISVKSIGKGQYYGWIVDQNHRFLLADFTIVRNCDQMYCTQCNTPFSWKTGKVETGQIHNPHYFEYMKRTGRLERNPLDIQCGREVDNHFVYELSRLMNHPNNMENYLTNAFSREILSFSRSLIHMRYQILPLWRVNNRDDNLSLRIQYLRNRITEEEFKKALQRKEKENLKKTEISNIIRVFLDCSTDILYRYRDYLRDEDRELVDVFAEVDTLTLYTNECLRKISQVYKSRHYQINSNWEFVPVIF